MKFSTHIAASVAASLAGPSIVVGQLAVGRSIQTKSHAGSLIDPNRVRSTDWRRARRLAPMLRRSSLGSTDWPIPGSFRSETASAFRAAFDGWSPTRSAIDRWSSATFANVSIGEAVPTHQSQANPGGQGYSIVLLPPIRTAMRGDCVRRGYLIGGHRSESMRRGGVVPVGSASTHGSGSTCRCHAGQRSIHVAGYEACRRELLDQHCHGETGRESRQAARTECRMDLTYRLTHRDWGGSRNQMKRLFGNDLASIGKEDPNSNSPTQTNQLALIAQRSRRQDTMGRLFIRQSMLAKLLVC